MFSLTVGTWACLVQARACTCAYGCLGDVCVCVCVWGGEEGPCVCACLPLEHPIKDYSSRSLEVTSEKFIHPASIFAAMKR